MALTRPPAAMICPPETSSPEPVAASAPLVMVMSSTPLIRRRSSGSRMSTVAKPCRFCDPMPTMARPPPTDKDTAEAPINKLPRASNWPPSICQARSVWRPSIAYSTCPSRASVLIGDGLRASPRRSPVSRS